jgi:hypothetical protein
MRLLLRPEAMDQSANLTLMSGQQYVAPCDVLATDELVNGTNAFVPFTDTYVAATDHLPQRHYYYIPEKTRLIKCRLAMSFIPPGKYRVDFMLKDQIITGVIPEEFQDFKVTIIRTPVLQDVSPKIAMIGRDNSFALKTGWRGGYDEYEEVQQGVCSLLPEITLYEPDFYTWGSAESQVCLDTRPIDLFNNYLQY